MADTPLPKSRAKAAGATPRSRKAAAPALAAESLETTESSADSLRDQASGFAKNASDKAKSYADTAKTKASDALHTVTGMAEDVARNVDERVGAGYGDYVRKAASAVSGIADSLDSKSVDDLVDDTRNFVKQRPAVAIGAAVAAGFVLMRLLRAGKDGEA